MKKTVSINLGGMSFIIDEDAYQILDNYLSDIEKRFSVEEKEEILKDVESRMAELLSYQLGSRNVVETKDVEEIIAVIGKPEDFGDVKDEQKKEENDSKDTQNYTPGRRRLYRDPENKVIGGVASGLAAYMNVGIVLMRLIFVILIFISLGWAILIYLILLIAMPEAKTTAQLLEMRGMEPSLGNINNYHNNDGEIKPQKSTARNILIFILMLIGIPIAIFFALGFIGICIAIFVACLTHTPGGFGSLTDIALLTSCGIFCLCPVIGITVLCVRAIRGEGRKHKWVGWTLLAIWILSLFGIIGFAVKTSEPQNIANRIERSIERYTESDDDDCDWVIDIETYDEDFDDGIEIEGEIVPDDNESLKK
ncbi:MAG: PspC domain-containing protein [Bacteroidales bacterium]|nr:PspC domain-containing protein [Bacteroidales bacterium]